MSIFDNFSYGDDDSMLDESVIEGYEKLIDLLELNPKVTITLKKCVHNPYAYYRRHKKYYEERGFEDEEDIDEEEIIWIGIVDTLIKNKMVFEFDWKTDLETFRYGMGILCEKFGLTIEDQELNEKDNLTVWAKILNERFLEKGYVIAAMDIESDSYCVFLTTKSKYDQLVDAADEAEHRIDLAQKM